MEPKQTFTCDFCGKEYKVESAFRKHRCKEMERADIIKNVDGQSAYSYYSEWMKCNRRNIPTIATFATSKYFTVFFNFAKYVKSVGLFKPKEFIKYMSKTRIDPSLWRKAECYSMYMEYLEKEVPPMQQANDTVNTLFTIAECAETTVDAVFDILHPRELIELIKERKLSPWILLCSKKFKSKMLAMDDIDYQELTSAINVNHWACKMEDNPKFVSDMRRINEELGI